MKTMRRKLLLLSAAASVLAACSLELEPQAVPAPAASESFVPGPESFTASIEIDPLSKAVLDLNDGGHPQTFWENSDAISIFTSADGDSHSGTSYKFVTSLGANSTTADFTLDEEKAFGSGMYFASYPYQSNTRGVNYTGSSETYRMAGLQIPASQTLVAGTFDKKAALAVAFTESGNALEFKNATALLKFRVAESGIISGRIEVDPGDAISGTFRADVNTSTKELSLETYGQPTCNYVDFTIDGSTPLSTGTDYYVAIRPLTLTSDLNIFLNGNLVKTINSSLLAAVQRNKIYNLGTLSTPAKPAQKVLKFDFSGTAKDGWPVADNWKSGPGEKSCTYPLYGTDYSFFLTDCGNASKARVAWVSDKGGLILYATWRYVGLPAIEGYKLVKVSGTMCLSTNSKRKAAIVKGVAATNSGTTIADAHEFVTRGEEIGWTNIGTTYSFNLSGTEANTVYYFLCTNTSVGVSDLTLTYVPI